MVLSKPRAHFAHQRTVRLIVDDDLESIDALKLAKSLPDYAGEIKGIVPLFGGKCFDITLATREAAAKLAQEGIDYEQIHKPLRLLGQRSIHVSVFVSVEFPDEDLLNLLATYGELKSKSVRRLFFIEEGFTHIENGIRVVQFNKIDRDIPKRVVLGGLEIGFKYSGQPVTCHRCHSTEHVVKNCPKRRQPQPPPPPSEESNPSGERMDTSTPSLFTQPTATSYASAASNSSADQETDKEFCARLHREEDQYLEELKASRGRKREVPPPTGSDDEQVAPPKKATGESLETAENSEETTENGEETAENGEETVENGEPSESEVAAGSSDVEPTPPKSASSPPSAGLRHFIDALTAPGWERSALMHAIPGDLYYKCRGTFLQYKQGDFSNAKRAHAKSDKEKLVWKKLKSTIAQDAFASLLSNFKAIQEKYKIFMS